MNTRQTLHELVDQLPDENLITAVRVLKGLETVPDDWTVLLANVPIDDEPFDPTDLEGDDDEPSIPLDSLTALLENAPIDDEPDDDDFDGGLTEALAETELIPHEEVKRRYLK
jgi:hypothetical protein